MGSEFGEEVDEHWDRDAHAEELMLPDSPSVVKRFESAGVESKSDVTHLIANGSLQFRAPTELNEPLALKQRLRDCEDVMECLSRVAGTLVETTKLGKDKSRACMS